MQNSQANLFTRDDTFFGVCQGLGEDLGINPLFLRLALPVPLFFYPVETIVGYVAVGLLVMLVRLTVPNPRMPSVEAAEAAGEPAAPSVSATATADEEMPLAA